MTPQKPSRAGVREPGSENSDTLPLKVSTRKAAGIMDPLTMIKGMTTELNKDLRENLRQTLIRIGKAMNDEHFIKWAKSLDNNGIEACLHFGFSEKEFIEFLGGKVELQGIKLVATIQKEMQ